MQFPEFATSLTHMHARTCTCKHKREQQESVTLKSKFKIASFLCSQQETCDLPVQYLHSVVTALASPRASKRTMPSGLELLVTVCFWF